MDNDCFLKNKNSDFDNKRTHKNIYLYQVLSSRLHNVSYCYLKRYKQIYLFIVKILKKSRK